MITKDSDYSTNDGGVINVSSKDSDYSVTQSLPKPYRDGFTEEQMAVLREYARTVLKQERDNMVDMAVLFGDDLDAAMMELARVVYAMAVHHDMPYVTAAAFCRDGNNGSIGHAYGQERETVEFTETMTYTPQEGEK